MLPSDPSTPETAPTPGELASPSPAGLEVPPTPVTPRPSGGARGPILGLAMVLVAVLAGSALFMSGFLVGQRGADQPGTPASAQE
ncbi:MAG: hypothetical protein QOE42_807, partial [Chloroflexota bacterium]|nr:hypothetical protein [Chloroflexota bacterium]